MMSRRDVLKTAATAALPLPVMALASPPTADRRSMIVPPRIKPGDLVALTAPASADTRVDRIQLAVKNVESLGLRVKLMPNVAKEWGYLAGTDAERAEDMNGAFHDPEIKGIITLRGGYGTMRMLPMLDYDAFRRQPKVVMGYSDITGLLNALTRKSRVVTYHGPIAEAKFEGFEGEQMRRAIFESGPMGLLANPNELRGPKVMPEPRTIQTGKARGRLVGGNLSLIAPCAGTPYGPDFNGAVLFLEDIGEEPYRVDRMLTSLWLGGHLSKLKGMVLGDFRPRRNDPSLEDGDFSMEQVFDNLKLWTKIPIFSGLYAGHITDKLTLPIGASVEVDADARTLTCLT